MDNLTKWLVRAACAAVLGWAVWTTAGLTTLTLIQYKVQLLRAEQALRQVK